MLSGRPLLATEADRRYLIPRRETDSIVRDARRGMNVLVLGERGIGKTTLLREVSNQLSADGAAVVYLDGHALDTSSLEIMRAVDDAIGGGSLAVAIARRARPRISDMPAELRVEEAHQIIRRLAAAHRERTVFILLDDPSPGRTFALFGRFRDELWQTGLIWIVSGDIHRRHEYAKPPADVFFDRTVEIAPFDQAQQLELVRRRLSDGDDGSLLGVTVESGNPRALLTAVRDALAQGGDLGSVLADRARRQRRADGLGRVESMVLAELEDGSEVSAADAEWLDRLGVSRQRAQQALAKLETSGLVRSDQVRGPTGRPRKVYRRLGPTQ